MKYWKYDEREKDYYMADGGSGNNDGLRVFSLKLIKDTVRFTECCDGWYTNEMSKEQAINALREMADFLELGVESEGAKGEN